MAHEGARDGKASGQGACVDEPSTQYSKMSRPRPKTTARPKAALLLLAATFALSAAPSVVALSPLQQKLNEFVENVQGAVADKDHVAANTARAIDNAKSRLASSGPLVTPDFFNKSDALDGGGGDDGIAVTVVGDPAQALLVGGVPAGNIVCYVNEAGVVVGLQQGNVTVCGVSSQVGVGVVVVVGARWTAPWLACGF